MAMAIVGSNCELSSVPPPSPGGLLSSHRERKQPPLLIWEPLQNSAMPQLVTWVTSVGQSPGRTHRWWEGKRGHRELEKTCEQRKHNSARKTEKQWEGSCLQHAGRTGYVEGHRGGWVGAHQDITKGLVWHLLAKWRSLCLCADGVSC